MPQTTFLRIIYRDVLLCAQWISVYSHAQSSLFVSLCMSLFLSLSLSVSLCVTLRIALKKRAAVLAGSDE